MGTNKTAKEVEENHIKSMGEPLGKVFYTLWQEVILIYRKWEQFVELYGTKRSRVELLNRTAPYFFRVIQDCLWEDTLLHIARLTDSPKSFGKDNLSIQALGGLIEDNSLRQNVIQLSEVAVMKSEFARDWRNRRIAHRDLKMALKEDAEPLQPASRLKVRESLDSIAEVLNAVSKYYLGSTTYFHLGHSSGGATALLYVLDDGLRAESERQARIERGEYLNDDLGPRDL